MTGIVDNQQSIVCIVFIDEIGQQHMDSQSNILMVGWVEDTSSNIEIVLFLENLFKIGNLRRINSLHTA